MELDIIYSDDFYKKIDVSSYVNAEEECISNVTLEAELRCREEAPVDTGLLRDSHYVEISNLEGAVKNDVEYMPYVVYGTSRQSPNNYPQRVVNSLSGKYGEMFLLALKNNGVDTE